jgi:hypothetical protein
MDARRPAFLPRFEITRLTHVRLQLENATCARVRDELCRHAMLFVEWFAFRCLSVPRLPGSPLKVRYGF